jgi:hypothetical protein
MDNTVYLGIVNYEHVGKKDFGEITSLVEGIPRQGQWFMVVNDNGHYQTVRMNWDLDSDDRAKISHYDPHNPHIRPGPDPPFVPLASLQANKRHIEVNNVSTAAFQGHRHLTPCFSVSKSGLSLSVKRTLAESGPKACSMALGKNMVILRIAYFSTFGAYAPGWLVGSSMVSRGIQSNTSECFSSYSSHRENG